MRKKLSVWVDTELSDEEAIEAFQTLVDEGEFSLKNNEALQRVSQPVRNALKLENINFGTE